MYRIFSFAKFIQFFQFFFQLFQFFFQFFFLFFFFFFFQLLRSYDHFVFILSQFFSTLIHTITSFVFCHDFSFSVTFSQSSLFNQAFRSFFFSISCFVHRNSDFQHEILIFNSKFCFSTLSNQKK